MRTYISTRTNLVQWIDQAYQKISVKKYIQLQLTAQVSNMFWLENFPRIPLANTYR